jgi:hypothetical protein
MQMVSHMVSYEQQLRQEVLLNIERLQAGQLSDEEGEEDEVRQGLGLGAVAGRRLPAHGCLLGLPLP